MPNDPTLFKNKYRIPSARRQGWDYGSAGWYFVTICTKDKKHYLGEIVEDQMTLSPMGWIVQQCWREIPRHFTHTSLDVFVVMPNHVHGIIVINDQRCVETQYIASLPPRLMKYHGNSFKPQSNNLASIIRGFKIGVTEYATVNGISPVWQSRYHDHIIRNADELEKIRWYIRHNPEVWDRDRNNI
jgi:REP element-mobilizing transposase RayT